MFALNTLNSSNIKEMMQYIPIEYIEEYLDDDQLMFYQIEDDKETVGVLIAEALGDICIIRFIGIIDEYRNKGYGFNAINSFIYRCQVLGFTSVQCRFIPEFNPFFNNIVEELNFDIYELPYGFHRASIANLYKFLADKAAEDDNYRALSQLSSRELKAVTNVIIGEAGDDIELPISGRYYDMECSYAYFERDNCKACLLIENEENKEHYIRFLYNGTDNNIVLTKLIACAVKIGAKKYGENALITAASADEEISKFITFIGKGDISPMVEAEYKLENGEAGVTEYVF